MPCGKHFGRFKQSVSSLLSQCYPFKMHIKNRRNVPFLAPFMKPTPCFSWIRTHVSSVQNPWLTFHYTDWSIGILILAYCNPHIWVVYNPLYQTTNQGEMNTAHVEKLQSSFLLSTSALLCLTKTKSPWNH